MEDETITLLSVDQEEFKVPRPVAEESKTIASIIADTSADAPVPLPNVKASILRKVIQFCRFNVDVQSKEGEKSSKSQEEVRSSGVIIRARAAASRRVIRLRWLAKLAQDC